MEIKRAENGDGMVLTNAAGESMKVSAMEFWEIVREGNRMNTRNDVEDYLRDCNEIGDVSISEISEELYEEFLGDVVDKTLSNRYKDETLDQIWEAANQVLKEQKDHYLPKLEYEKEGREVLDFADAYEEKGGGDPVLQFLTNSLGEYDIEPPEAPYAWYEDLCYETSSLLYLVKVNDEIGILANNEFDDCFCEDTFSGNSERMYEAAKVKSEELNQSFCKNVHYPNVTVFCGKETGFDECHEVGVFIPFGTPKSVAKKMIEEIDAKIYEIPKELAIGMEEKDSLSNKIQAAQSKAADEKNVNGLVKEKQSDKELCK